MTINQTSKANNLADDTVQAVEQLMRSFEKLTNIENERAASGIDLTLFDFSQTSIPHVDGAILNAVLNTSIPAIWAFMEANFHTTNLQKARP